MEIQIQTDTDTLETDSGHSVMSSIHLIFVYQVDLTLLFWDLQLRGFTP